METTFKLLSFFLVTYGIFRLLRIDIGGIRQEISDVFDRQDYKLKQKILILKGKRKENRFINLIKETKNLLELTGRKEKFEIICFISVVGTISVVIFCMAINNIYLAVPLSVSVLISPFVYVKVSTGKISRQISEELETALSIITNSYMRNENIILAVEENINYINEPVKSVFKGFIAECNYISPDIKNNLISLREKINNPVFVEYCNALISCQGDISMKNTLYQTVKKLSNIRIVTARLDGMMFAPIREYFMMVAIYLINLPLFYLLNKEWYKIVMETEAGHIMVAVSVGILAITTISVLRLTKPIVYRR